MTMNRCKPILSGQAVNLLRFSTSTSSQANTSITSTRRVNTNHGGDKKKNNNVWFAVGTATAASALAYKLFQDRDRFLLHAKEVRPDITPDQLSFDNRVRQFSSPD